MRRDVQRSIRLTQLIFVISLAPVLSGGVWLFFTQSFYGYFILGLLSLTGIGYILIQILDQQGRNTAWFLSLAVFNLLFLTPEVLLRIIDFHYESGIQFAFPTSFQRLAPDPDLFWTLPPQQAGVNSFGFAGDEVQHPKPEGLCRLLFLGDSVPGQGYPTIVEQLLNQVQPQQLVESVNLALAGYSSHQGRAVVQKYGRLVDPDVVVVSYGWNDHWLAYGSVDSQKVIEVNSAGNEGLFLTLYRHSRLLQAGQYGLMTLLDANAPLSEVRVSSREYAENLTFIGDFFATQNISIIFITPPAAHHQLGVPDYLVEQGFAADKASVITLHRAYNQVVRTVAARNGWLVLDLEREFENRLDLPEIFLEDGIHLTDQGLALIADRVADFLTGLGCLDPK